MVAQIVKGIWPSRQKHVMGLKLLKTHKNPNIIFLKYTLKKRKKNPVHIVWEHYISFNGK